MVTPKLEKTKRYQCSWALSALVVISLLIIQLLLSLIHNKLSFVSTGINTPTPSGVIDDDDDNRLMIDVISIGSKSRPDYQEAQRNTFASHKSIRHFFVITEDDDADPTCAKNLGTHGAVGISNWCHNRRWRRDQKLMNYWRGPFARAQWLRKKANPAGWMCAQVRPAFGFAKALSTYQLPQSYDNNPQGNQNESNIKSSIPDWLVVIDDDSYFNFELFGQHVQTSFDPNEPRAIAGCLVRSPVRQVNMTIPFGGFGIVFSKAAIINFLRPITCAPESSVSSDGDDFLKKVCQRIKDDQIDERPLFKDGMSVADLMKAYSTDQPFVELKSWKRGNCLHSDWIWGFFVNYYYISRHVDDPFYADVPHSRLEGYNESEIYAGRQTQWHLEHRRICDNNAMSCDASSHICHYQTPEMMKNLTNQVKAQFPNNFRL